MDELFLKKKLLLKKVMFVNFACPWNELIFAFQYQDLELRIDVFEHKILKPLLPWLRATDTHPPTPIDHLVSFLRVSAGKVYNGWFLV